MRKPRGVSANASRQLGGSSGAATLTYSVTNLTTSANDYQVLSSTVEFADGETSRTTPPRLRGRDGVTAHG